MRRCFYLYSNKKGLFIVEFVNPDTGVRVYFRNTQTRDRDEAYRKVTDAFPFLHKAEQADNDGRGILHPIRNYVIFYTDSGQYLFVIIRAIRGYSLPNHMFMRLSWE